MRLHWLVKYNRILDAFRIFDVFFKLYVSNSKVEFWRQMNVEIFLVTLTRLLSSTPEVASN